MFRIIPETNINFIGARKIAFVLSLALLVLGGTGLTMILTGQANLGIDFAGGTVVKGYFSNPVEIGQLRSAVGQQFSNASITNLSDFIEPNAFIIKIKKPETEEEARAQLAGLKELITSSFAENPFTFVEEHQIGPAVGKLIREQARWAVLISILGIIAYIWIRFDFRSGIAATVATFHDVLAVIGIFWILGLEFDLLIITALLTLAGYSLTDTVVVYDRIRENLRKYRTKGEFTSCVNSSINEVLSRTFNTSITVIFVVGTIFLFGGDVLQDFSLALILGVLVGTYSSIFIASPIVVEWEARSPKRFK